MNIRRLILLAAFALTGLVARAQNDDIIVDYNAPKSYVIGGIRVAGNQYVKAEQIVQISGLREGMRLNLPGDEIAAIHRRLWQQRYLEDIAISIDSLSSGRDTAWLRLDITERPRMSAWDYSGIRSGEKKDLNERLHFRRGGEFSDYVQSTSVDIIKR